MAPSRRRAAHHRICRSRKEARPPVRTILAASCPVVARKSAVEARDALRAWLVGCAVYMAVLSTSKTAHELQAYPLARRRAVALEVSEPPAARAYHRTAARRALLHLVADTQTADADVVGARGGTMRLVAAQIAAKTHRRAPQLGRFGPQEGAPCTAAPPAWVLLALLRLRSVVGRVFGRDRRGRVGLATLARRVRRVLQARAGQDGPHGAPPPPPPPPGTLPTRPPTDGLSRLSSSKLKVKGVSVSVKTLATLWILILTIVQSDCGY
eukprot:scaffold135283_cov25-Tisochrysis_lutea.AAC.1